MGALAGKKIVVTRARHQAGEFIRLLREHRAEPVAIPTIEIVDPESWEEADAALGRLGSYHWIILTSVNGVKFFLRRVQDRFGGLRALAGHRICAVGPRTREAILREGLQVDFMPTEHVAEAIVDQSEENWEGKKVLFARAAAGRDVIPEGLRAAGAEVDVIPVYRNVRPETSAGEFREVLVDGKADAITFTSASTVKNFACLFEEGEAAKLLEGVTVASIGPVTAAAAKELGIESDVMPKDYTISALTAALEKFFEFKL
jgi:uroporphyrinogen III methyltransferase/synthase